MSRGVCVIGVGGSGQNALIFLKERLIEAYGKVPESVVLLSLDTAAPEGSMSISGVNLKIGGIQRVYATDADRTDRGEVELVEQFLMQERKVVEAGRPDEFFPLVTDASKVKSVDDILGQMAGGQTPHFNDWVQEISVALSSLPQANKNIAAGAGMYRPLGRMALFLNYKTVYAELANALQRLFGADVLSGDKYNVVVTGSVAGGTGSGIFIDVLVLIRKILDSMQKGGQKRSVSVTSLIVLPSAFQKLDSVEDIGNLKPNSYAALRELDRFQLTHSLMRPTLVRYGTGVNDIEWVASMLSDYVYLVDSVGHPRHSAFPAIADYVATKVIDSAGLMIDTLENNFDAILTRRSERKQYLGLNTFSYIVPINDIVRSLSFRYLQEMHRRLFASPGSQERSAAVERESVLRVEELFSPAQVETLNRNGAPENTLIPTLMRAVIDATRVHQPKPVLIDWASLLQLLARTQDEYQEDYQAFQQALAHIEGTLLTTIEYSRKEDFKEGFEDGARRLVKVAEDLMTTYLGPQHDPDDPQSRTRGHWDIRLGKYDELRDAFAKALDFAVRDELNQRDGHGRLKPNRLVAAHLLVENVHARLKDVVAQMDASMNASGAPARYVSLLTQELKQARVEMEETMNDMFIPLLAEKPLKKQKAYIEAVREYLGLEMSLRIFACTKRLLDIFGAQDAYEWKDDEGRAHRADSIVARALKELDNWRSALKETDQILEEARRRHEQGRRDKAEITIRRYLTDEAYEDKIYERCLPALNRDLQGKGVDGTTFCMHWAPKRHPNDREDEAPLLFELVLDWIQPPGVGPVDLAIHFMQGAYETIEPIVREGVTIVKRLYEMKDFQNDPNKLAMALEQQVNKPLLRHNAQDGLQNYRVLAFPYRGPETAQKSIKQVANQWISTDKQRKVDARNVLEPGESAASLTTISFTGALALPEVEQFTDSMSAYRLKLQEIGKPVHVFPEEQQAVKFEQQTPAVFPNQPTPRTLSPEVVISMADRQKLLLFAAACAYGVIRRAIVDPKDPLESYETFLFLPGEARDQRKQLSHSTLIEVPRGQKPSKGQQYLDALQQFCIVKTQRVGLGNNIVALVRNRIQNELRKDPYAAKRSHEQIHPFALSLGDVESAIQKAKEKLGPTFDEEPDPREKIRKNAENCLNAIATFKREKVDFWMESQDVQVQDLGILMAILLHEIEIPLREQAGD